MNKHVPKYAWVAVTAVDWTHTSHEQLDEDEAMDLSPVGVRLAGHLIKDSDDFVTLASQVFEDGTYRHLVSIPTGCILELIQLMPTKEPGPDGSQPRDRFVGGVE